MFKLNLKIAWRNILKYKTYTAINIGGLALGLSGFIFMVLFINHEKSYDIWNPKLKNIYQVQEYSSYYPVEAEFRWKDQIDRRLSTIFSASIPTINGLTMIEKEAEGGITISGKPTFLQQGLRRADSLFFKVFPYDFKFGSAETAFSKPFGIVLKADLAKKYFGEHNPLGKTIVLASRHKGTEKSFTVTGVIEEPQTPSSLNFTAVYVDDGKDFRFGVSRFDPSETTEIYINTSSEVRDAHFDKVLQSAYLPIKDKHLKQFNESVDQKLKKKNQPLIKLVNIAQVHQEPLQGASWQEKLGPVFILSILLLLVSIVNFVNLATAQVAGRAKEIGIKKVVGAQKGILIRQFLTETILQCFIALFLGLFIVELLLPTLNEYFSLKLSLFKGNEFKLFFQLLMITVFVALLTGIYPAFFISSYQPKDVLKGNFSTSVKGILARKGLVGVQFVITTSFIVGILFITSQVNYLRKRDNGFSKVALLNVKANFSYDKKNYHRLKNIDGVKYVGFSSGVIGSNQPSGTNIKYKGATHELLAIGLNMDGLNALDARLLDGRFFSNHITQDTISNVMINESAAKLFANKIVGEHITVQDSIALKIIGVIKDIQVSTFEEAVKPSIYVVQSSITDKKIGTYYSPSTLIKFEPAKLKNVITELEKISQEKNSFYPLTYSLLEDEMSSVLIEHERFGKMVTLFSWLSLLLSLFGLFSLAAFITKQRYKEIAIRKVLGAENTDMLLLLNKGYVWIILIANAIAIPISYILIRKWLSKFAYSIEITPLPFIIAFLITLIITIITVTLQATKAVSANPVKMLKYE